MTNLRNSFTNCDDFANYVLDYLTDFGNEVTKEFNDFLGTYFKIGTDLYKITEFPNTGKNFAEFGSVKGWLYDIYELRLKNIKSDKPSKTNIMKTLILSITICVTVISCSQAEAPQPARFKFYNADTNLQIKDANIMMETMKQNKLYRLDVKTGECYNYTTNQK